MVVGCRYGFSFLVDVQGFGLLHDDFLFLRVLDWTAYTILAAHVQGALRVLRLETALIHVSHRGVVQLAISLSMSRVHGVVLEFQVEQVGVEGFPLALPGSRTQGALLCESQLQ